MSETCIKLGKHGARVMIENKEIPHYAMHVDAAKKEVSCWIASQAEKAFSVVWMELDLKFPSACDLHLDGRLAASYLREKRKTKPMVFKHGIVSKSSSAPFIFSQLVVTDDDTYLDTPSHSIGEIKLVISRQTIPRKVKPKNCTIDIAPPQLQKVHERSKKGLAHRVNYGTEIPTPETSFYESDTLDTLMTFIFRYRPLEMLRANGIVPQNSEPLESQDHNLDTPPTSETSSGKGAHSTSNVKKEDESGPETDDSDSDEDSLREKALLAELEKIRKGKKLKDKRLKKKFKKEEKPVFTPGEIIDLT